MITKSIFLTIVFYGLALANTITPQVNPQKVGGTCPPVDPPNPVFFPDTEWCQIYYECSNGYPLARPCPVGLYFNPTLNVCDFPENAGCQVNIQKNTQSDAAEDTQISVGQDTQKETNKVGGTCPPVDPPNPVYLPDTESCTIFYECSNGRPIQLECAPGTHFSPSSRICNWPEIAGCAVSKDTQKELPIDTQNEVQQEKQKDARKVAGKCPAVDSWYPVYFPDTESCSIFYECSNGRPIQLKCPDGLHFNPVINVCDWPQNAGCNVYKELQKGAQKEFQQEAHKVAGTCPAVDSWYPVYFPDTESCSIFYECSNGRPIALKCPDGLHFNPIIHVCDWPQNAGCTAHQQLQKGSQLQQELHKVAGTCPAVDSLSPVYFPDTESCSIFYECSNGRPIALKCPDGLHFNPVKHVCDWPQNAGCTAHQDVEKGAQNELQQKPNLVMGTCPAVDSLSPVYFPDTDSCSIFYECSNGRPIALQCPVGLHFNPVLNVCDWPRNAGCHINNKLV